MDVIINSSEWTLTLCDAMGYQTIWKYSTLLFREYGQMIKT